MKKILLVVTLVISISPRCYSQNSWIDPDYWGYQFIEKMEATGYCADLALRTRPFSRDTFTKIIDQIQSHKKSLSESDCLLLLRLAGDLRVPLSEPSTARWGDSSVKLDSSKTSWSVRFNGRESLIGKNSTSVARMTWQSETGLGLAAEWEIKTGIAIGFSAKGSLHNSKEGSSRKWDRFRASPRVLVGAAQYPNQLLIFLRWQASWGQLFAGQSQLDWGPSYLGGLALSRNMPATPMLAMSTQIGRFRLSSSHLFLNRDLGAKYLAAHRLDVEFKRCYLGLYETVIYGRRHLELSYLNPLMPYHIAEHHLGDRDNNMLGFDAVFFPTRSLKLYCEVFIDDMNTSESLLRYFGNKFAFTGGALISNPLGISDLSLRIEYTRVEPFVYTHWDSLNIYSYRDSNIGSRLGPNADCLFLQMTYPVTPRVTLQGFAEYDRKGPGTTSTITRPPHKGTQKIFLGATPETRKILGLEVQHLVTDKLTWSAAIARISRDNLAQILGQRIGHTWARLEIFFGL